jgi:short-subunit dehydrogenase
MTIFITGASRGIGAQLAIKLAKEKHQLILLARNEKRLKEVCQQCNLIAGQEIAFPLVFDLLKIFSEGDNLLHQLLGITNSIDRLVNNAGLLIKKNFENFSIDESRKVFDMNYFAPEKLIRQCLPLLRNSSEPSIVNVTSMGAVQGSVKFPGMSVYSASKGALAILTECLAEELKTEGIKVNALALGAVQTEMLEEAFPGYKATTTAEEMGGFFKWFVLEGCKRFNGKMLPVSDSTP